MSWEDIARKLTSRKFWTAVCALVTNIIIACGGTEDTTVKMTGLIMAGATVIAYIIGEGLIDAANAKAPVINLPAEAFEGEDKPPEEEDDEDENG